MTLDTWNKIVIGIATPVIGLVISGLTIWNGINTSSNSAQLKAIEAELAASKFGFEQIKIVYEKTTNYLSDSNQSDAHGRVLIALIRSIPETTTRAELLAVLSEQSESDYVAAQAASTRQTVIDSGIEQGTLPENYKQISEMSRGAPISSKTFSATWQEATGTPYDVIAALPSTKVIGDPLASATSKRYTVTTLAGYGFLDSDGTEWRIPKDVTFNGNAVNRLAWNTLGPPLANDYTFPLMLYKYQVVNNIGNIGQRRKMLFEALLKSDVNPAKTELILQYINAEFLFTDDIPAFSGNN
ncbi:hypothetical protein NBZ79_07255 [Sneathiella marina]|uniref:Uncharacterized protein n=1 Tax=Sneathiella marina TaxID=2950108 RepID=A0ABY4W6G0_9PROT|nr:hypothetical protein [Sneathiella marina]USG62766.1 hypothetical protein NBZ79_07215 [Sneathiella marina]USG62772.1 hypothetical protein NBZ79_07255 [Sneathiella marina]